MDSLVSQSANEEDQEMFDGRPLEPYSVAHGPDSWDTEVNINAEYPRLPPYPVDEDGEALPETVEADKDVDITMDQLPDQLRQPLFTAEQLRNAPWAQRRFYPSHLEWLDQEAGYEAYSTLRENSDRLLTIARQELATANSQGGDSGTSQSLMQVVARLDSLQAERTALLRENITLGGEVQQLRAGEVDIANPHLVRQRQVYIEKQQKTLDKEIQRNKDLQALLRKQQEARSDEARIRHLEARIRTLEAENPQPEVNAAYDEVERMRADRDAALTAARVQRENYESGAVANGVKEERDRLRIEVEDLRVEQDRSYVDFQRLFHERGGLVQGREILTNELAQAQAEIARLNGGGDSTALSGVSPRDPGLNGPSSGPLTITTNNVPLRRLNQATAERDAAVQSERAIRAEFQAHIERSNVGAKGIRDFNEYLRESLWARSTAGVIAQRVVRDERDQLRRRVTDLERELATQRDPKNLTGCEELTTQYNSLLQDRNAYRNRVNGLLRWNERMHDLIMNPNFRSELGMNLARDGILSDVIFEDGLQAEEDRNLQEAVNLNDPDDEFLEINVLFGGEDNESGGGAAHDDAEAANDDGDNGEQAMEDMQNDSTSSVLSHQATDREEASQPNMDSSTSEQTANQNSTTSAYIGGDRVRYPLTSLRRVNEDEAPEPPGRFRPDITDPCERRCAYLLFILRQNRRVSENQARELIRSECRRRIAETERDARPLNCDQYRYQAQQLGQRVGQLVDMVNISEDVRNQLADLCQQADVLRMQAETRSAQDRAELRNRTLEAQQQSERANFAVNQTVEIRQVAAVAQQERDAAQQKVANLEQLYQNILRHANRSIQQQANQASHNRTNAFNSPSDDSAPDSNLDELDDCEERCAQKQARIEELEKELATTQSQRSQLESEVQMYCDSQDAQQQPSDQLGTHAGTVPTTGNSQEPDDCEGRCRKMQKRIDELDGLLRRAREMIREDAAFIPILKNQNRQLQQELDTYKNRTSRDISPSADSFYSAASQPAQLNDEEPCNPKCKKKCDYLQKRLDACEARRAELQRQGNVLEAISDGLQVNNTNLLNQIANRTAQTHQQSQGLGAQISNTQEPDDYWKIHAKYLEQDRTTLRERISQLEKENFDLNQQISEEDCKNRITALQKIIDDVTKKLRKEIDAHVDCKRNGRLQAEQIRFDAHYLRRLQGMIADRNNQFRQQLQNLQTQLQAAGLDVDDALMDSLQRMNNRCNDLEDEIEQLNYTIDESQRAEQRRTEMLQQTNDSIQNERTQYQQLLGESSRRYASYETRLRDTGIQLMQRTQELNITKALHKRLQNNPNGGSNPQCDVKCVALEEAIDEACVKMVEYEMEIDRLKHELDQCKQHCTSLRQEYNEVQDQLGRITDPNAERTTHLEAELDNDSDCTAIYIAENENLRKETKKLEEEIQRLQDALNNCRQHGNLLRQERNELQHQYSQLIQSANNNQGENTTHDEAGPQNDVPSEEVDERAELEALEQELTHLRSENVHLQTRLTECEETNSLLLADDDEAAVHRRILTRQNESLNTRLQNAMDTLGRVREVNDLLNQRREDLIRQLREESEARRDLQRALNQCNDRHLRRDAAELGIGDKIDRILDGGEDGEDGENGLVKKKESSSETTRRRATLPQQPSESSLSGSITPASSDSSSGFSPRRGKARKGGKGRKREAAADDGKKNGSAKKKAKR